MRVEHRMSEEAGGPLHHSRQRVARIRFHLGIDERTAEGAPHRFHDVRCRGLIQRDPKPAVTDAEIDLLGKRPGNDRVALGADVYRYRVEERLACKLEAEPPQACGQHGCAAMNIACDLGQPLRAVIDRIHRGDHRQQHLRGADVGGGLLAANVLLAGLQGEAIGRLAPRIHRQPDDAAGQRTLQHIAHRHEGCVGSAITHRHAEALRRADRDVGA